MHTQSFPQAPRSADEGATLVQVADRVGATASFLCALHCAALPFVLALLPALGLSFLADHSFERWFIAFATVLALTMMIRGYRRHGAPQALYLLLPGLVLLWLGGYVRSAILWPVACSAGFARRHSGRARAHRQSPSDEPAPLLLRRRAQRNCVTSRASLASVCRCPGGPEFQPCPQPRSCRASRPRSRQRNPPADRCRVDGGDSDRGGDQRMDIRILTLLSDAARTCWSMRSRSFWPGPARISPAGRDDLRSFGCAPRSAGRLAMPAAVRARGLDRGRSGLRLMPDRSVGIMLVVALIGLRQHDRAGRARRPSARRP
jgi:hypothetical protein